MFELLKKSPDFRTFFFGQAVSQIGDRIHSLALIWIVYNRSNSTAAVGGIMIATTLPAVLISPFAGTVSDRLNKKTVMIFADILRGFIVIFLSLAAFKGFLNYPILIIATVIMSLAAAFFNPSALSIIPDLVSKEDLTKANAMNQLSGSASAVLGPLFGSLLIASIGVPTAFLFNGISFFASMFFILKIKFKSIISIKQNMLKDMKEGFKIILKNRFIMQLMLPIIIVNFFFSAVSIIIPAVADGIFSKGSTGIGIMMSAFGGGMLVGTLILSNLKKTPQVSKFLTANFVLMGLSFLFMGIIMKFNFSLACLFVTGLTLNIINVILIVIFQQMLDSSIRGKVMALITATALSLQPVSYGITGMLLDVISPSKILIVCGIIISVCGFYIFTVKKLKEI